MADSSEAGPGMKEHPILFSGPMVRALLDETKTQTRRIWKMPKGHTWSDEKKGLVVWEGNDCEYAVDELRCPYGDVGDRLWVREAWRSAKDLDAFSPSGIGEKCVDQGYRKPWAPIQYEADGSRVNWTGWGLGKTMEDADAPGRIRASMHMPRWACRLVLEIISIRVERLNDISIADALAEGVRCHLDHHNKPRESIYSPVGGFRELWESINGAESWDANPWVWVVEFKKVAA